MAKIDHAKRRRIMQRSMQLGHCICDPRRPCPCDVFTQKGLCPCAGERPAPADASQVKLTQLVHNAGCASKIAAGDLEAVLSRLPAVNDPAVISGLAAADDAGIYKLTDDVYLVQTVDVMTPCVDDPYTFGRICAANCLSDIYAMGGVPRTALSVLAFPSETLDGQIMYHMMKGAMDVLADANVALIGGHSIKDDEIKLGFAITGTIEAGKLARHDTAAVGDVLVLTKPLGVGVLNFARQIGREYGTDFGVVERSMAELNRTAAEAMNEVGASACTDITGFGLYGHLISMARHSGVTAEIWAGALPAFDGAAAALRDNVIPGAIERNTEYVGDDLTVQGDADPALVLLGYDAQTSGGLMISVPADRHERLLAALKSRGILGATIGRMTEKSTGRIVVTSGAGTPVTKNDASSGPAAASGSKETPMSDECCSGSKSEKSQTHSAECCAGAASSGSSAAGTSLETGKAFGALMKSATAAGKIDERTKELIVFSLVVLSRCGPCIDAHLKKALEMGISRTELDEAAWLAVAMGGAPVRMFYTEALAREKTGGSGKCC